MEELKPCWILENPFYQYQNFKDIIEYSGFDFYCFYKGNKINKKDKNFYDLNGNKVNPADLKDKYSVIIKTGSGVLPTEVDVLQISKSRKIIQTSHSIIGLTVDCVAGIPLGSYSKLRGIFPEVWLNVSTIKERYDKLQAKGKSDAAYKIKTHPFMVKVLEPIKSEIEKDSLGILTSNCSHIGNYVQKLLNGLKIRNKNGIKYNNVYIKRHPLSTSNDLTIFEPLKEYVNNVVYFDKDADKNEFFDKCQTIIAGMSSTFAESNLRNNYYNRNQKIYGLDEIIRVGMSDNSFGEKGVAFNNWELDEQYKKWTQYDDMLNITDRKEIYDEFLNAVNEIILNLKEEELNEPTKQSNKSNKSNKCVDISSGDW